MRRQWRKWNLNLFMSKHLGNQLNLINRILMTNLSKKNILIDNSIFFLIHKINKNALSLIYFHNFSVHRHQYYLIAFSWGSALKSPDRRTGPRNPLMYLQIWTTDSSLASWLSDRWVVKMWTWWVTCNKIKSNMWSVKLKVKDQTTFIFVLKSKVI